MKFCPRLAQVLRGGCLVCVRDYCHTRKRDVERNKEETERKQRGVKEGAEGDGGSSSLAVEFRSTPVENTFPSIPDRTCPIM